MSRVVIACRPAVGHINFTLPLASQLRKEGHTVVYVTRPTPWSSRRIFDHGFSLVAFDPEAIYGVVPSGMIALDDVVDWKALVRIFGRNLPTRPWPYLDERHQRELLQTQGDAALALPHKIALWCLINEAQCDPELDRKLAGWEGGDPRWTPKAPAAVSAVPARVWQRNRQLIENAFFPGVFRSRAVEDAEGQGRNTWLRQLCAKRRLLRRFARFGGLDPQATAEYRNAVAADVILFEPFARTDVLVMFQGSLATELQYSFYSSPGFRHPPLDCSVVADGRPTTCLRIAAAWATRLTRFRLRRLGAQVLAGSSPEGVFSRLLSRYSFGKRVRLTYSWNGKLDVRDAPKLICSPRQLEFTGLTPPESCRYFSPILRDVCRHVPSESGARERPLIYCTLGTEVPLRFPKLALEFFRKIVAIFSRRPSFRLVVSAWTEPCRQALATHAGNVVIEKSVDQDAVLGQSVLAIHHSGHNTVLDCIQYGVPMLVFPQGGTDQRGVAARVVHHRLGLLVERHDDESALEAKIDALLEDSAFRSRVATMRERIQADTPESYFPHLLEAIRGLGPRQPPKAALLTHEDTVRSA